MPVHPAYPSELTAFVRTIWPADAAPLPAGLEMLLSETYQASLRRDEERPTSLRVVVAPPTAFAASAGPPRGVMRLLFDRPRTFEAAELTRLAPAAKYARSLVGVSEEGQGFAIWGVVHSGPRWLELLQGGRSTPPDLPGDPLVVRAFGPGLLTVARGDREVAELRAGVISRPGAADVFASTWMPARFAASREELYALHLRARMHAAEPWGELDPDLARVLSYHMVKRVIATMRAQHHGGALLILPPDLPEADTSRLLRLKYAFREEEPRRRHRTLVLAAMRALARLAATEAFGRPAGWTDYANQTRDPFLAIDEAILEVSHILAGFADVDGAVVVNRRWEILGFGAEIVGDLPEVPRVAVAHDIEATQRSYESTDAVGTRHRSAYRLCAAMHDAMALVVSQDGLVRWVAWHDGAVTCWSHIPAAEGDEG
jgi:hypothetical protein